AQAGWPSPYKTCPRPAILLRFPAIPAPLPAILSAFSRNFSSFFQDFFTVFRPFFLRFLKYLARFPRLSHPEPKTQLLDTSRINSGQFWAFSRISREITW